MIRFRLILLLFILPFLGHAQENDKLGNWWIYFGNKKLKKGFNIHHEIQYRNYNFIGDLEQLLIRGGLGYNLTENNNNILLGYGYINTENDIETTGNPLQTVEEHRIYQQFQTKQSFGTFSMAHRYRFEQRFVEDDFRTRFRYFLAPTLQLTTDADKQIKWYVSAYDEIFLNGEEGNVFDRNRLYGGVGAQLKEGLKVESGYMNQFFSEGGRDQLNVILRYNF